MAIWDFLLGGFASSPREERDDYQVVDVPGTWTRTVAGTSAFEDTVDSLRLGRVKVTLRLQSRGRDGDGVAAYIREQQVGWLATQRSGLEGRLASGFLWRDPWVSWISQLDAAGIQPRFHGLLRMAGDPGRRIINIDVPGRKEPRLSAIAKQLISAKSNGG
ncbi:MAG: hypothetical protein K0U67_06930 [Actinomycetia bacterium]|nr:hypothetical protein [Actinomycetes bacterium]